MTIQYALQIGEEFSFAGDNYLAISFHGPYVKGFRFRDDVICFVDLTYIEVRF